MVAKFSQLAAQPLPSTTPNVVHKHDKIPCAYQSAQHFVIPKSAGTESTSAWEYEMVCICSRWISKYLVFTRTPNLQRYAHNKLSRHADSLVVRRLPRRSWLGVSQKDLKIVPNYLSVSR